MPDFGWFEAIWKQGWPVIKGAPIQFFLAVLFCCIITWLFARWQLKERLDAMKERHGHQKERADDLTEKVANLTVEVERLTLVANTTPTDASSEESFPVNVEFSPSEVPSEKLYLRIVNRSHKQRFEAQCRIIAHRNDPNPPPLMTFNLQWEYGGGARELKTGETGNLWIASAGDDPASAMEWMRFESPLSLERRYENRWDSQWPRSQKRLPEFDVEITVFGQQSNDPQSERFTVRAGKVHALEMFKRHITITTPQNGGEVGHRHIVGGTVGLPNAKVQVFLLSGNNSWYHQGDATVNGSTWNHKCWFGNEDSALGGSYQIVAIVDGNIQGKEFVILPDVGLRSNEITVRRTRN